jgi:hypothetical protein
LPEVEIGGLKAGSQDDGRTVTEKASPSLNCGSETEIAS